ncbi:uncharacterized protein LOC143019431 [Oratosquilla oratoria]|uniref:uncharacterized protein LOC143019431 n=1 Tax=Oratosquilla oratoria TaxID=337810 RepID=UPI003F75F982
MDGWRWSEGVVALVLLPLLLPLLLHPSLLAVSALHPVHDAPGFRPSVAGSHSSDRPWPYFGSSGLPNDPTHPSEQPFSPPTPTHDPLMAIRRTYHPLADESASSAVTSAQEASGKEDDEEEEEGEKGKEVETKKPEFDPTLPGNVTAQRGSHAFLPCRVLHRGDKSVSWVRKGDSHILSVNQYIFITDDRFVSLHQEASDTWSLQIKYVQARDSGMYECQVSTEPKISKAVYLNVISPKVSIAGQEDVYVKAGSTVSLKCVITNTLTPPQFIFWYQEPRVW